MQEKINKINSLDSEIGNIESALYVYGAHGKLYLGREFRIDKVEFNKFLNNVSTK